MVRILRVPLVVSDADPILPDRSAGSGVDPTLRDPLEALGAGQILRDLSVE